MTGLHFVLDTGALIAAEARKRWALRFFDLRSRGFARLTIPRACVVEWWAGRTDVRERILAAASSVEPLSDDIARAAGIARAKTKGAGVVDAIVMATAALRNANVVTRDVDDFRALGGYFTGVRVFGRTDDS